MELHEILAASQATDAFKADVLAYVEHHEVARVTTARRSPRVKVVRLLTQLLSAEGALPLDRVHLDALSGCADFTGTLVVELATGGSLTMRFAWDCHWRAEQQGWTDAYGLPDQIRAAREFDWRCFQQWERVAAGEPSTARPAASAGV